MRRIRRMAALATAVWMMLAMMGSGAVGQAPPQLGVRAMALVWRNPSAGYVTGIAGGKQAWPNSLSHTSYKARNGSTSSGGDTSVDDSYNRPHQTRILFYRQFE